MGEAKRTRQIIFVGSAEFTPYLIRGLTQPTVACNVIPALSEAERTASSVIPADFCPAPLFNINAPVIRMSASNIIA